MNKVDSFFTKKSALIAEAWLEESFLYLFVLFVTHKFAMIAEYVRERFFFWLLTNRAASQRLGWKVVSLPFSQWESLRGRSDLQSAYLRKILDISP